MAAQPTRHGPAAPGVIIASRRRITRGPNGAVERAVEAGTLTNISRDGGLWHRPSRTSAGGNGNEEAAAGRHLHAHVLGTARRAGRVRPRRSRHVDEGRKRGVLFDVGHGGGNFAWRIAAPAMKEKLVPDTISTDLHIGSMNGGMKDMLNVMGKFLAMGMAVDDVMARATWNAAKAIRQEGGSLRRRRAGRCRGAACRERSLGLRRQLRRADGRMIVWCAS